MGWDRDGIVIEIGFIRILGLNAFRSGAFPHRADERTE